MEKLNIFLISFIFISVKTLVPICNIELYGFMVYNLSCCSFICMARIRASYISEQLFITTVLF